MPESTMIFRIFSLFFLTVMCGCGATVTTKEISGTTAERIAAVVRIIQDRSELPSKITDAHLIERKIGDGQLGPADYRSFVWIKISPEEIANWKSALQAIAADPSTYDAPTKTPPWWISQTQFAALTKYDPHPLFGRHGWIAIDDNGNVYAMTYTM